MFYTHMHVPVFMFLPSLFFRRLNTYLTPHILFIRYLPHLSSGNNMACISIFVMADLHFTIRCRGRHRAGWLSWSRLLREDADAKACRQMHLCINRDTNKHTNTHTRAQGGKQLPLFRASYALGNKPIIALLYEHVF